MTNEKNYLDWDAINAHANELAQAATKEALGDQYDSVSKVEIAKPWRDAPIPFDNVPGGYTIDPETLKCDPCEHGFYGVSRVAVPREREKKMNTLSYWGDKSSRRDTRPTPYQKKNQLALARPEAQTPINESMLSLVLELADRDPRWVNGRNPNRHAIPGPWVLVNAPKPNYEAWPDWYVKELNRHGFMPWNRIDIQVDHTPTWDRIWDRMSPKIKASAEALLSTCEYTFSIDRHVPVFQPSRNTESLLAKVAKEVLDDTPWFAPAVPWNMKYERAARWTMESRQ